MWGRNIWMVPYELFILFQQLPVMTSMEIRVLIKVEFQCSDHPAIKFPRMFVSARASKKHLTWNIGKSFFHNICKNLIFFWKLKLRYVYYYYLIYFSRYQTIARSTRTASSEESNFSQKMAENFERDMKMALD
jgi:hypothetical protein